MASAGRLRVSHNPAAGHRFVPATVARLMLSGLRHGRQEDTREDQEPGMGDTCRRCYPSGDTTMSGERSPCRSKRKAQAGNTCWPKPGKQGEEGQAGPPLARKNKVHSSLVNMERGGGASWERDGAGERGSLAFCSHQRGKAVSFAGLIGLMRFPYSSLRGCQQARLGCHFPLLTAYPLCKRRRGEGRAGEPR